jgi:hypothetical protein
MAITINGTGTVTGIIAGGLPDAIITQPELATNVAGTGPAFSAYLGTTQSITSSTFTKISINTEEFDTNNNFDSTTNYRFTPTVSGYYQVNGQMAGAATSGTVYNISIYKNGSAFKTGNDMRATSASNNLVVSALVYLNGSTDYIELYGYITGTSPTIVGGSTNNSYFQASMVRAA